MFLVYATVWIALIFYTATVVGLAVEGSPRPAWRIVWSVGCAVFIAHVAASFSVVHGWSHTDAWEHTQALTEKLTGVRSGAGLYLNYAFTLFWLADAIWWWIVGENRYRKRSRIVFGLLHLFFLFMIFNGAFLFAKSPARWFGLALSIAGTFAVVRILSRKPSKNDV